MESEWESEGSPGSVYAYVPECINVCMLLHFNAIVPEELCWLLALITCMYVEKRDGDERGPDIYSCIRHRRGICSKVVEHGILAQMTSSGNASCASVCRKAA